jgi:predicted transcriptional regulator
MHKTTLYLPDDLKAALGREARQRGVSEARLIRDAIAQAVTRPMPRAGIIATGVPLAEQVDEYLKGFGER